MIREIITSFPTNKKQKKQLKELTIIQNIFDRGFRYVGKLRGVPVFTNPVIEEGQLYLLNIKLKKHAKRKKKSRM